MARFIITLVVLALAAIPLASASAIMAWLRFPRPAIDLMYRSFCRVSTAVAGIELLPTIWHTDTDRLPAQLVIVSNHESHMDVPSIVLSLRRSIRFVAKASLFRIPFFGWGLGATGNIRVDRNRIATDLKRLRDSADRARDGDVLFFAEGTCSSEGSYRPFKKGAFMFAILQQRPILPVAVGGSFECLPARRAYAHPGKIAVVVGEPIPVSGLTEADRDVLRERVQDAVAALREEALRRVGSPRAAVVANPRTLAPAGATTGEVAHAPTQRLG